MTAAVPRPRVLLLDAGNTIVFLDHVALAQAAAEVGIVVHPEALARAEPRAKRRYEAGLAHGMSHEDGWHVYMRGIFEDAGLDAETAERGARAARRAHDGFNLWRKVPTDLPDALDRLERGGVRVAIVSNSEGQLADLLERLSLMQRFELVIDSGLEGVRKPDPEIFRRALTRLGIDAKDAIYAGDIPHVDVDGARAAGMDAVLIDPFDHYPEYREARKLASVAELVTAMGL